MAESGASQESAKVTYFPSDDAINHSSYQTKCTRHIEFDSFETCMKSTLFLAVFLKQKTDKIFPRDKRQCPVYLMIKN